MRIGLISYANLNSGVGVIARDLIEHLPIDSMLAVKHPVKGHEQWIKRQKNTGLGMGYREVVNYCREYSPDVLLFVETPFCPKKQFFQAVKDAGVRTVGIPMHESSSMPGLLGVDLLLCPCLSAYRKAGLYGFKNSKLMFLPIGISQFPYRERAEHTFIQNIGFAHRHNRRQTQQVVGAFHRLKNRKARLILNCQEKWPDGSLIDDDRITYNLATKPRPADLYKEGDISLGTMAYGGYERTILEAMASGMPTLVTNADPMRLFQHDTRFRLDPCRTYTITADWVVNTVYHEVSIDDLRAKMEWLLTIDTAEFGLRARRQAEAQSWESKDIDYKSAWINAIGSVL